MQKVENGFEIIRRADAELEAEAEVFEADDDFELFL